MLINNIDIKNFNATLIHKEIGTAEVITYDEWLRNSLNPIINGQEERYTQVKVKLLIEDSTEEEALMLISSIVNISKRAILKFDNIKWYFNCTLESKQQNRIINGIYELELTFKSSYKYADEVVETLSKVTSKNINVPGNLKTPCLVEIVPSIDIINITLQGLSDDPIIIKNLKANQKVIINGEDDTVLCNGINKFGETDLWEFPRLVPGNNTIILDKDSCDVVIKYKSRWI